MPSDSKKREQQRKKDAQKKRNQKIPTVTSNTTNDEKPTNGTTNGVATNGAPVELTEEGRQSICFFFYRNNNNMNTMKIIHSKKLFYLEILCAKLEMEARINAEARACTGSLAVHPRSRDIKIANFSITFFGSEMLQDTMLELNCGRRYGLIGLNGCGKSSLLAVLGNRETPIQDHIDIFHLSREIPASTKTALECVMEVDEERLKLEKLAEDLATREDDESQDQLMDVYERLDDMSADQAEAKAARLLHGLGFTKEMQRKQVSKRRKNSCQFQLHSFLSFFFFHFRSGKRFLWWLAYENRFGSCIVC